MTSGGQCVMTTGTALMLQLFAISWDMPILEVRKHVKQYEWLPTFIVVCVGSQVALHSGMVTSVLV